MSRTHRSARVAVLEAPADFDEQLYTALRTSPWWMISIAFHVLLFVLSALLQGTPPAVAAAPDRLLRATDPIEQKPDLDDPEGPDEVEGLVVDDLVTRESHVVDPLPIEDKDRIDNDDDLHDDPYFGAGEVGTARLDGPSTNSTLGLGGGAGGGKWGLGSGRWSRSGTGRTHTQKQDEAVDHALRWLAAHQSPDGSWEAAGWQRWADGKPAANVDLTGQGKAQYDVGVTGLALLAFLGAGHTHRSDDAFGPVVARGLRSLKNVQDAEGCFGARASSHYVYDHAIASLAMVEAYGMTYASTLKGPAQKGLEFLALARNPYGAWRYGIKPGDNDTSVTGWTMMALKSARLVNASDAARGRSPSFAIDEDAFDGIRSWIDRMTDPDSGRVGYQQRGSGPARTPERVDAFPAERSESMTAVGVLARVFLGENPATSKPIASGVRLCRARLPTWNTSDGSLDMYYWYYATLAMFQVGGDAWHAWDGAMKSAMVDTQRTDGDYAAYKGSWDPLDVWGADGGRVYSTAVLALCLEVYYRYDRVFTGSGH